MSERPSATSRPLVAIDRDLLWPGISVVAIIVGSLGPWATYGPFSIVGTAGGRNGIITLVLAVIAGGLVLVRRLPVVVGVLALGALATGIYDTVDVSSIDVPIFAISVGWGIILVDVASASLLASAVEHRLRRSPRRAVPMVDPPDEMAAGDRPDSDVDAPTREAPAAPEPRREPRPVAGAGGRRWVPWATGGAVVAVLAAVGVVLALTVFSSSDHAGSDYQAKIDQIMRPLISANRALSTSLTSVSGTAPKDAENQVGTVQAAVLTARGGLDALTVPSGSAQLASNARATLTRETAYLAAVREALMNPASGSAAQTQTLAGNLTSALDVIAPPTDDWSGSVTGADALTAWAPRAVATARARVRAQQLAAERSRQRRAAALRKRQKKRAPARAPVPAAAAPAAPSGGTDCGSGVHAGPATSCPFAFNVQQAYNQAPGVDATVEVYSPTTGQTYAMTCSPAGNGVTCSGANNASVTW